MPISKGKTILNGKYHILRLIGEGGMARVWLADDIHLARQVAIKEPHAGLGSTDAQEIQERFQREVKVSGALDKARVPNIVRTYTVEPYEEGLLLVMEYMPGGDLEQLLRQHPQGLPLDQAIAIAQDILPALAAVHEHPLDIVHRDIKPSNILFDAEGRARLADFGLAQVAGWSGGRSHLMGGAHPGTIAYMAPEQSTEKGYLTPAADVYALGATLFEMLTGKKYKRYSGLKRARDLRPDVPRWLDALVTKAVAESPPERWMDGEEMLVGLQQKNILPADVALDPQTPTPVIPKPPEKELPPPPKGRGNSSWMAGGIFAIIFVLAFWLVMKPGSSSPIAETPSAATMPALPPPTATSLPPVTPTSASPSPVPVATLPSPPTATPTIPPTPVPTPAPTIAPAEPQETSHLFVEYLIDASNGMMQPWTQNSESKLASIQRVLPVLWQADAAKMNIGLRAYGHRRSSTDSQTCDDVELLRPIRQWEPNDLITSLFSLRAQGLDSSTIALREAYGDFQYKPDRLNAVLFLTEGGDTCDGDPFSIIKAQQETGVLLPVFVIALEPEVADRGELQSIASESGGQYFEVNNPGELYETLTAITQALVKQTP